MGIRTDICRLFKHKRVQKDYIHLLRKSQTECQRDGKTTMEVGIHRERDLIAILCKYMGRENIRWDIPNSISADVLVKNKPVSIKHKMPSKHSESISSFKVKWTANATIAKQHVRDCLENEWEEYIIVSEIYPNEICMYFICPSQINTAMKIFKDNTFKAISETNNGRGIEFSENMLNLLKYGSMSVRFKADIFSNLNDPIEDRLIDIK